LEIWSHRLSRQRSTYMYILMNHWIATNTTGSHCLKIVKRVVSYIIFTLCSKYPPPAHTKISDVDELKRLIKIKRANSLNHAVYWRRFGLRRDASVYVFVFVLKADISSIWCKDDVTYYTSDNFWDNNC